jgi:hypothetical protein
VGVLVAQTVAPDVIIGGGDCAVVVENAGRTDDDNQRLRLLQLRRSR